MRCLLAVVLGLVVGSGVCLVSPPAAALTFNLNFPAGATDPNDPTGSKLQAIVQEAANRWSDIIEDSHTMTLNVSYYDENGGNECNGAGACAPNVTTNAAGDRVIEGDLFFLAGRDWYFDPTPSGDSEFDFTQTLLLDLTPSEQAAGYSGNLEPALEVGFRGTNNGTDPNITPNSSDMLSTALHEIGHHLGVTNQFPAAMTETNDIDYDIPPSLLGGRIMAVKAAPPDPGFRFHFADSFPAMSNVFSPRGTRRLPTATDVFAMAAVSNWANIDLPQKVYSGAGIAFSDPANWLDNRVPNFIDSVTLRHGGNVLLSGNTVVGEFKLGEASTFATGPFNMFVQGNALVGTTAGIGTARLTVSNNGTFGAKKIVVDEGTIALAGGVLSAAQSSIDNAGRIEGNGSVRFDFSFTNNGTISASGGTLVIEEAITGSGATIDLDGSVFSGAVVEAITGSLDVDVGLAGATSGPAFFSGTMTIGPGQFIDVGDPVRQQSGTITLDGSGSQVAEYRGPELIINSTVVADRLAAIDADVELIGNGDIQVPQSNDSLSFQQSLDLLGFGTNITGLGSVTVQGELTAAFGSIDVGELNLNGDTQIQGASIEAGEITAPGTFVQDGGTLAFGKFTGKLGQNDGVIEVSNDSRIIGDLLQESQGELNFEISSGTTFSQLNISQTATLPGMVNVTLTGGYDPLGGEQFLIILADSIDPDGLTLGGPDAGRFQLLLGSEVIVLEAIAPLLGDYNNNGIVDAADYAVWLDNLGSSNTLPNDATPGTVTQADYNVWKSNFGSTSGTGTATAVPEPAGALLIALALLGICAHPDLAYFFLTP